MHYPGSYWAATEGLHVGYESRLELARLLFADFDPDVTRMVAQPFLISAVVDGRLRRHVPDYLLMTATGPLVVDVKPKSRLDRPKVAFTLAWTRRLVESRGWRYEVWSEPPSAELENIRFLAGYRRAWLFSVDLVNALLEAGLEGATLGEAFRSLPRRPAQLVRSAVLHLLWRRQFTVDLCAPLSSGHVLRAQT